MGLRSNVHGRLPGMRKKVKPGVAVCLHCRAILDQEKAAKHGLGLRTATMDEKRSGSDSAEKKGKYNASRIAMPAKEAL
jgi:hypothetical protein